MFTSPDIICSKYTSILFFHRFLMVKQQSSVAGVYLVGPAGGKLRPWCGHCHKFLKSETAPHDCTPINLSSVRKTKLKVGRRRIRLTDKNRVMLGKVFEAAALGEDVLKVLHKIKEYSKKKKINGKRLATLASSLDKGLSKKGAKRASSLKKRFL